MVQIVNTRRGTMSVIAWFIAIPVLVVFGYFTALTVSNFVNNGSRSSDVPPEVRPAPVASSWQEQYKLFLQGDDLTSSEVKALERAVVVGSISADDYEKSHRRYVECMTLRGFPPNHRLSSMGFYMELPFNGVSRADDLDTNIAVCSEDFDVVEALYRGQLMNPELLTDGREVAVACLLRAGVVPSDYMPHQFQQEMETRSFSFEISTPAASECLWGAGYAMFELE